MKATNDWYTTAHRKYSANLGSSRFVHLTKYTAEVKEIGTGSPIILIPGLAGGSGLLGPLAKALADDRHVLTYQLRGENDCFALRHPFELDDLVDDLAELIDAMKFENPTIMGVSFGAIIALKFAIRHPHRLDRLILQGVGARFERNLIQQIASTVLSRFPLPADSPFVNQFFTERGKSWLKTPKQPRLPRPPPLREHHRSSAMPVNPMERPALKPLKRRRAR